MFLTMPEYQDESRYTSRVPVGTKIFFDFEHLAGINIVCLCILVKFIANRLVFHPDSLTAFSPAFRTILE